MLCCRRKSAHSPPSSLDEIRNPLFWRDLIVEAMASCLLLAFVTFAFITCKEEFQPNPTTAGLVVGFTVFIIIEAFGPISGAHMNPVVSAVFLFAGKISLVRGLFYTLAQCVGGICGSAIVYAVSPARVFEQLTPFGLGNDVTPVQGVIVEAFTTFFLIFTILSTTSDDFGHKAALPSFPIGFTVGVSIMATGTFTKGALNPIVALGPATVTHDFTNHWVYWVGPYLGGAVALTFYQCFSILSRWKAKDNNNVPHTQERKEELTQMLEALLEEKISAQKESFTSSA